MRAEFFRGDGEEPVAAARWEPGRGSVVETDDDELRAALNRIFRLSPVVADDPSMLPVGSRGEAVVQPGNLEWFRAAALARAGAEGLRARLVPEVAGRGGWDPASAYRTFRQSVGRLLEPEESGQSGGVPGGQAGERRRAEDPTSRH